jgi:ribosomal protein S18 acetylase RimI-like enzyme
MAIEFRAFTPEEKDREDIEKLMDHLSPKHGPVLRMVRPNSYFVGAFDNEHLIAMGSLFLIPKLTKITAHLEADIEDVVVNPEYARQGIGEEIMRRLLRIAADKGADYAELTSGNTRTAAHRLYKRLDFKTRDTTVFRYEINSTSDSPAS